MTQFYRRELLAGDSALGWGEIPNNIPFEVLARIMADRERDAPHKLSKNMRREQIEQAGLLEYRMAPWFKHATNLRSSAMLKYIREKHGAEGVVAAMNLYEVLIERFGNKSDPVPDYTGVLRLCPPRTKGWLAMEILPLGSWEEIDKYLATFHDSGLIVLATDGDVTTLTVPGASKIAAEWQQKAESKKRREKGIRLG